MNVTELRPPAPVVKINGKRFKLLWREANGGTMECLECGRYTFTVRYGDVGSKIKAESYHICTRPRAKEKKL